MQPVRTSNRDVTLLQYEEKVQYEIKMRWDEMGWDEMKMHFIGLQQGKFTKQDMKKKKYNKNNVATPNFQYFTVIYCMQIWYILCCTELIKFHQSLRKQVILKQKHSTLLLDPLRLAFSLSIQSELNSVFLYWNCLIEPCKTGKIIIVHNLNSKGLNNHTKLLFSIKCSHSLYF